MGIQSRLNTAVLLITHDVDEAVLLSDRVMMMTNGPAAKVGEVMQVALERPRSRLALANDRGSTSTASRYCSSCTKNTRPWPESVVE